MKLKQELIDITMAVDDHSNKENRSIYSTPAVKIDSLDMLLVDPHHQEEAPEAEIEPRENRKDAQKAVHGF
jgi:hypothetical protein